MDTNSLNQTANEKKALELLDTFDEIILSDAFNKTILDRIKTEEKPPTYHRYRSFAAIAASIVAVIMIWNFNRIQTDNPPVKIAGMDMPVVENMDLLDKMEILEHLDVLSDTESTKVFLRLLEKG